jgi:hypothetical protein
MFAWKKFDVRKGSELNSSRDLGRGSSCHALNINLQ